MKIHLAYGKRGLDAEVPDHNLRDVLRSGIASRISDHAGTLRSLLSEPIESQPLGALAKTATSACIAVCDITRPVPNKILLPAVLDVLEESGVDRRAITILVATGLHRPSKQEELIHLVGEEILRAYTVVDHHARENSEQRFLGVTVRNTPVYIDRRYCDADLKMSIGFIEPHLMAGFSGGRKTIGIGCAGEETIKTLHSPFYIEHPDCSEGSIDGNPLHEELLEIARMAGHDFTVEVVLDREREIIGMFAGDPWKAHAAGVAAARKSVTAPPVRPADIVITTAGGFPLDLTYYQSIKGLTAALPSVKKGGVIILACECAEGLGSPEFTEMATRFRTAAEFLETVKTQPVVIDQWQLEESAKAAQHAEIVVVSSGLAGTSADRLFVRRSESIETAIEQALSKFGSNATIAVIPEGPYTLVNALGA